MSTVFITGGSRGIGAAVARTFAYKGWSVAFSYLNSESEASDLQQELAQRGVGALAVKADVSDPEPVSYTHLDVYKRQPPSASCPPAIPSSLPRRGWCWPGR